MKLACSRYGNGEGNPVTFDPAVAGRYVVHRASAPSPSKVGEAARITIAVRRPPGTGVPSGEAICREGPAELGRATLDVHGRAIVHIHLQKAGDHALVVEYTGDANFSPSSADVHHRVE